MPTSLDLVAGAAGEKNWEGQGEGRAPNGEGDRELPRRHDSNLLSLVTSV
jgi:hypothetical protein